MDTTASAKPGQQADVSAQIELIKARMPQTYAAIKGKAESIGNDAYRFVRAGLRGEPNCFYAIEAGHVMGTPFDLPDVHAELARVIVQFGCRFLIMWAPEAQQQQGGSDGTR
jgi:hypothetical protein